MNDIGCQFTKTEVLDVLKQRYNTVPKLIEPHFATVKNAVSYTFPLPFPTVQLYTWDFQSSTLIDPGLVYTALNPKNQPFFIGNLLAQVIGAGNTFTATASIKLFDLVAPVNTFPSGFYNLQIFDIFYYSGAKPTAGQIESYPRNGGYDLVCTPMINIEASGTTGQVLNLDFRFSFVGFRCYI